MIHLALAAIFAASPARGAADAGVKSSMSGKQPLLIDADHLHIEGKKQEALWRGHVKVKRGTTNITCDRMLSHYTEDQEVSRVECHGNVEVLDQDKWAKGDRADFDNITGILIVTGDPEAKQGGNHVRGTKVIFSVDTDTIEVENATAILKKAPEAPPGGASDPKKDKTSEPKREKTEDSKKVKTPR
jgi:lipopolysaccharide export system protein LptA